MHARSSRSPGSPLGRRARRRDHRPLARPRPRAEDGAQPALEHRHRPHRHARAGAEPAASAASARAAGRRRPRAARRRTSPSSPTSRSSASPAQHFVHDFFLPGTQLTFPQSQARQVAVARRRPVGHDRPRALGRAPAGRRAEDRRQDQGGRAAARHPPPDHAADRRPSSQADPDVLPEGGRRPAERSRAPATAVAAAASAAAAAAVAAGSSTRPPRASACPRGSASSARAITTPEQTLRQVVDPPQTNITSTTYTIGGVDPAQPYDRPRHARAGHARTLPRAGTARRSSARATRSGRA